jgi:methylated-DNA-[protein]-cysteine S-methyltransferase
MTTAQTYCIEIATPLGKIFTTATADAITGLYFEGQKYFPVALPIATTSSAILNQLHAEITEYFAGKRQIFSTRLLPAGTAFQQTVWQQLAKIPSGKTLTYAQVAELLGKPTATRAVASAIGRNPISVIIPCHRVIGSNGSLTGYAGGIERKAALLQLEQGRIDQRN